MPSPQEVSRKEITQLSLCGGSTILALTWRLEHPQIGFSTLTQARKLAMQEDEEEERKRECVKETEKGRTERKRNNNKKKKKEKNQSRGSSYEEFGQTFPRRLPSQSSLISHS